MVRTSSSEEMAPQLQILSSSSVSPSSDLQSTQQQQVPRKQPLNAGALLEQYTHDDDQTTDLLYAIRNWNLEQRPSSSSESCDDSHPGNGNGNPVSNGNGNHHPTATSATEQCCSSTIATNSYYSHGQQSCGNTSISGTWTNDNESSSNHNANAHKSHPSRGAILSTNTTPKPSYGNYSSRPSALTAMILERTANHHHREEEQEQNYSKSVLESPTEVDDEDKYEEEDTTNRIKMIHHHHPQRQGGRRHFNSFASPPPPSYVTTTTTTRTTTTAATNPAAAAAANPDPATIMAPELHQKEEHSKNNKELEAMQILSQTADLLGLCPTRGGNGNGDNDNDDNMTQLRAVLPTVQKLVKVITQHVPRLEQFVEQVCEIVEEREEKENDIRNNGGGESGERMGNVTRTSTSTSKGVEVERRKQIKRKKRRSRMNMEARKERMDQAVTMLKRQWKVEEQENMNPKETRGGMGGRTSQEPNGSHHNPPSTSSTLPSSDAEATILFRAAVKKKMTRRFLSQSQSQYESERYTTSEKVSEFEQVMTPTSSNRMQEYSMSKNVHKHGVAHGRTHDHDMILNQKESSEWTDEEALEELDHLMDLKQKYNTLEQLAQLQVMELPPSPVVSPSSSEEAAVQHSTVDAAQPWQSPIHILSSTLTTTLPPSPDHDTVITELLNADTTTLRKFVLHFAYLFNVSQREVVPKMNALYVFSQEANELIQQLRNELELSPSCPIHYVAREVLGRFRVPVREGMEYEEDGSVSVDLCASDDGEEWNGMKML